MAVGTEQPIIRTDPDESRPILQQSVDAKVGQTLRFGKNSKGVPLTMRLRKGGVKRDGTTPCTKIRAAVPLPHHSLRSADARETLDVRGDIPVTATPVRLPLPAASSGRIRRYKNGAKCVTRHAAPQPGSFAVPDRRECAPPHPRFPIARR